MSFPKLSVITINLNNVSGLKKTIESVVNQMFIDYEFIIIDGGSTDGSIDVIREYAHQITQWISEPDKGIYNAMNKALQKSNGEYLHFLNSGDWYVDQLVLKEIFSGNPDFDLIYGNLVLLKENGERKVDKGPATSALTFQTFFWGTINHQAAFLRRNLFIKYGLYDEELKIVSDWKFFLVAFGLNPSSVLYKDLQIANFDMTGISKVNFQLKLEEREKVLRELVPSPILTDYLNNKYDAYFLVRIRKHSHIFKFYRLFQKAFLMISEKVDSFHF